jgi:uncharacterized protein DUF222
VVGVSGILERMSEELGISRMSDVEVLEYMQQLQRERSIVDGRMVRAMAHFESLRQTNLEYVGDEVAAALSLSRRTACGLVSTAVQLAQRLPGTVTALESGQLDMSKARAILEWTEPLPVEQARGVAAGVQEWSVGRTAVALRQKLSREVLKVDPQAAEARRRARIQQREVRFFPSEDGMASLTLYDQADRVRAIFTLLDHLARQAKAAGDPRTLDALRADALGELLMGSGGERVRVELRVTVPASVLAGVSDDPGWLHGYGPITRDAVWELAARHDFWRRIVTDPLTGTVVEVSRRNPPGSLREYVNTRTPTCVGVGCHRPAETCEADHTRDYALGGVTAEANLGPTCRHHNLMKLNGGWRLEQPEPGSFVWTTPAGLRYEVPVEPVVEPTPDPVVVVEDKPPPF